MKKLLFIFLPLFIFSSCVEIIDDLLVRKDGSGTLKLTVNLSSSKLKINSALALDSLNGVRVPKLSEIDQKFAFYAEKLREKEGIKLVTTRLNSSDFIYGVTVEFSDVEKLESALKEVLSDVNSNWVNFNFNWISWENGVLSRNNIQVPDSQVKKLKKEEVEDLKKGTYTSITRFQSPIEKYSNELAKVSENKLNIMIKSSAYSIIENTQLLKNTIKVENN